MDFVEVSKARQILDENAILGPAISVPLLDSLHGYSAYDIYAPYDLPLFDNSAMDGYCMAYSDVYEGASLEVKYIIQAGDTILPELKKNEAARIFTGAALPRGADTVVMQEKVKLIDKKLIIEDPLLQMGSNVRPRASQTQKGELILTKHTKINAGIIGFLAGFGLREIAVFSKPKIGIIVTGKELIQGNSPLQAGQIHESNTYSLRALLAEMNISSSLVCVLDDDPKLISATIADYLNKVDILLLTGGISVGDHDYVLEALEANEVQKLFYKVKQKPGKPLYFGKKNQVAVFALPGNPASTFTCFHQYVRPFLEVYQGQKANIIEHHQGLLAHDYFKKGSLTNFVKAYIKDQKITISKGQESYKMDAFSKANCIVELKANQQDFQTGEQVPFIYI